MNNIDLKTVEGFGEEWDYYDQSSLSQAEHLEQFERYFEIFPWDKLPKKASGFDMGCGSGRWAVLVAEKVSKLYCFDASLKAINVAKKNLSKAKNAEIKQGTFDAIPLKDESMDFGYSLGVLHHVPDTFKALEECVKKLKVGAPFLLYIYYAFDNRPFWFKAIWKISDIFRNIISRMPFKIRRFITSSIALTIYFPLAKTSSVIEKLGFDVANIPLSHYRHHSLYTMQTDALDRFGTQLEGRFTRKQIEEMMQQAGLENIIFSDNEPYWCAIGYKK